MRLDSSPPHRPQPLAVIARLTLLILVATLTWLVTDDVGELWWAGLLAVAAVPALAGAGGTLPGTAGRVAEVVVVGLAAGEIAAAAAQAGTVGSGLGAAAVLPYLGVPLAATALRQRHREAIALLVLAAATLTVSGLTATGPDGRQLGEPGYLAVCAQWLVLAGLGVLAVGALHRAVLSRDVRPQPQPYAEATRLLTQLRGVARQLPGATLDPGSISEHLLEEIRTVTRADRAAVLSASGGGRLVVLAQIGADRVDWETTIDADSAIAEAWASQQPQTANRSQARSHPGGEVSALVVPLVAGVRTVGLMTLEADIAAAYPPPVVDRVAALVASAALRLEAALLFDEVRSLATNEERQRLAREIHDGVAQELVMVGYGIDNALATLPEAAETTAEELRTLRGEVTRVITELRLSLFELRSEVDRHGGLGAAIAEYARTVGSSAGLRVNLSLDEPPGTRLPAAIEAELLRIAQEAITNARKHSGAANLWVTCAVDPPYAQVEVSDDGQGIPDQQAEGRYGLAIMKERAERIRGRLEITPRQPSGTTVTVVVGSSPRRDSVRGSVNAAEGE